MTPQPSRDAHRRRSPATAWRQRGAAILAAMMVVTLVAAFSAAALWQQWRSVEVEAAERARMQSAWVLVGALDWARLIIREDSRAGGPDHLAEPWAVPLQEARLSTFLAADRNNTGAADPGSDVEDAFLSGQITDLQSRLNVMNLTQSGGTNIAGFNAFTKLFQTLDLPAAQLEQLSANLRFASDIATDNRSAALAPLMPQTVDELAWLGLPPKTLEVLKPYVAVLPSNNVAVNVNTASAQVIYAAGGNLTLADAQQIVARRDRTPFRNSSEFGQVFPDKPGAFDGSTLSVNSNYFEALGRLRLGDSSVQEVSVIHRAGRDSIRVLHRARVTADLGLATAPDAKR